VSFPDVVMVGRTSQVNCTPRSVQRYTEVSQRDEPASGVLDLVQGETPLARNPIEIPWPKSEVGCAELLEGIKAIRLEQAVELVFCLEGGGIRIVTIREIIAASSATESEVSAHATIGCMCQGCGGEIGRSGPGLMIA
jgi:hypothetical protein